MKATLVFIALVELSYAALVAGFAYLFASEAYCGVNLICGSTIMGSMVSDGNLREIMVCRNSNMLTNGSLYVPGEVLLVNLSFYDVQYAYEVTQGAAVFEGGACNGNRLANSAGNLVMPSSGDVILVAGTASHYGGLTLTATFTLSSNASVNFANTTLLLNQSDSKHAWHEMSQQTQIIVGVIVGVTGLALVAFLLYWCVDQTNLLTANRHTLAKLPVLPAIALALTSVGLVAAWAQHTSSSANGTFLGVPSWSTNLFAWHPVLMVGGFFAAQVIAISLWSLDSQASAATAPSNRGSFGMISAPAHYYSESTYQQAAPSPRIKLLHVFFQCAALATLIAGLAAIVRSTLKESAPSLTTMHSWYGVAAVAVFGTNFLFGK